MATVIENIGSANAGQLLVAKLPTLVQHLAMALTHYSRKNLRVAYEALTALSFAVGPPLIQPELVNMFMPVSLAAEMMPSRVEPFANIALSTSCCKTSIISLYVLPNWIVVCAF